MDSSRRIAGAHGGRDVSLREGGYATAVLDLPLGSMSHEPAIAEEGLIWSSFIQRVRSVP